MGSGLVGVVAKPISGGLDLVSKTAEGIKNTASSADSEEKSVARSRLLRPFYTKHRLVSRD